MALSKGLAHNQGSGGGSGDADKGSHSEMNRQLSFRLIALFTCKMDGKRTNVGEHLGSGRSRLGEPGGRGGRAVH